MITGDLKNKIDKIWEVFRTGGIANPLSVIEQLAKLTPENCTVMDKTVHNICIMGNPGNKKPVDNQRA